MRGRVGTDIVTCDVGVSRYSKTHPLFMKYSNGTSTQCYAYHYPSLFPVLFLQSLYVPLNFSFIFVQRAGVLHVWCILVDRDTTSAMQDIVG